MIKEQNVQVKFEFSTWLLKCVKSVKYLGKKKILVPRDVIIVATRAFRMSFCDSEYEWLGLAGNWNSFMNLQAFGSFAKVLLVGGAFAISCNLHGASFYIVQFLILWHWLCLWDDCCEPVAHDIIKLFCFQHL